MAIIRFTINEPVFPATVNAGDDQNLQDGTVSTTLMATADGGSGNIVIMNWTQIAGNPVTIVTPNSLNTQINGLQDDNSYTFRITVANDLGSIAFDDVIITVEATNLAPIADAGPDQNIFLPLNAVALNGLGSTDPDGVIVTYLWEQIAGPGGAVIDDPSDPTTDVDNLVEGNYTFRLTVTDNEGAQGMDEMNVTVNAAMMGTEVFLEAGFCGNIPAVPNPSSFYVVDPNIANGDTIYQDINLTIVFNGGNTTFLYENSGLSIPYREFNIDNSGIVSALTVCSTPIEVVNGNCGDGPPPEISWLDVYIENEPINNGDVIYQDADLTTPYAGGGATHQIRIGGIAGTFYQYLSIDIDNNGIVSNYTVCSVSILIDQGNCGSVPGNPFNTTVYVVDENVQNGDIIYQDELLVSPFDGGNLTHLQRIGNTLYEMTIDNLGVVSALTACATAVEVGVGVCGVVPVGWLDVYVVGTNTTIQNGDTVYSDEELSTTFNGGGSTYRIRIDGITVSNIQFDIDAAGLVSNVFTCLTAIEIGEGDCGAPPGLWLPAFADQLNVQNGDIIYNDIIGTSPFNGGGNLHRVRPSGGGPATPVEFNVDINGVVSGISACP